MRRTIGPWPMVHLLVVAACLFALGFAYFIEHVLAVAPCKLCYTQRTAYWIAAAISLVALIAPPVLKMSGRMVARWGALLLLLSVFSVAIGGGYAGYHTGVEFKWWEGPTTCTGIPQLPKTLKELEEAPVVMPCDEAAYKLFGLSLAMLNALYAVGLVALCAFVAAMADGHRWRGPARPRAGAEAVS